MQAILETEALRKDEAVQTPRFPTDRARPRRPPRLRTTLISCSQHQPQKLQRLQRWCAHATQLCARIDCGSASQAPLPSSPMEKFSLLHSIEGHSITDAWASSVSDMRRTIGTITIRVWRRSATATQVRCNKFLCGRGNAVRRGELASLSERPTRIGSDCVKHGKG